MQEVNSKLSAMDQQHSVALTEQMAAAATLQQEVVAMEKVQIASQSHILSCLCDTQEHWPSDATYLATNWQGQQLTSQVSQQHPQDHTRSDCLESQEPGTPSQNPVMPDCRDLLMSAQELHQQRRERPSWQHLSCVCNSSWRKHRLSSAPSKIVQKRS